MSNQLEKNCAIICSYNKWFECDNNAKYKFFSEIYVFRYQCLLLLISMYKNMLADFVKKVLYEINDVMIIGIIQQSTTIDRSAFKIRGEEKRDLTQSYDKSPYTNRKFNNQLTTQKRHQNFDYSTIVDRLRMVRWSNNGQQLDMVKSLKGCPTVPLTATAV